MAAGSLFHIGRNLLNGGLSRIKTNERAMNCLQITRAFVCMKRVVSLLTFLIMLTTISVMFKTLIARNKISTSLEKNTAKREFLLLSYGRSGTSFTSGIISYHPDVFFFFEPLHGLEFHGRHDNYFVNTHEDLSRKIIGSFFNCDLLMETAFLFDSKMFLNSNSTKDFWRCLHGMRHGVDHLSCFNAMVSSCRRHNTVLIKTIRYRVKWTESLLETRPDFKLLLLYRDPRATLHSQSTAIKNFNWTLELVNVSEIHCRRLEEDMREAERLRKLYPDRVKCIRYEDGATDPQGYARDIYQYLGLELDQRTIDYVINLTTAHGNITLHHFSIERNAKEAMSKWRYKVDYGHIQVIDRTCGHLYSDLGYSMVSSEEDLKSTRPLVNPTAPGKLF